MTAFAGLATSANILAADLNSPVRSQKLKIIVAGGHPGDPEYGCGGTISALADAGHDLALLYLNRGDPNEAAGVTKTFPRVAEAEAACKILKARALFAGQIDGHAVVDAERTEVIARIFAAEKPDAVFTHWPIDNHADHRAMSNLVYGAWRQDKRAFALYYYEVSNGEDTVQFAPTEYFDISATEARKRAACFAHASQTPERYYPLQEMIAKMRGAECGHKFAEAFAHHAQSPKLPGFPI